MTQPSVLGIIKPALKMSQTKMSQPVYQADGHGAETERHGIDTVKKHKLSKTYRHIGKQKKFEK